MAPSPAGSPQEDGPTAWQVIGASVVGAAHLRSGLPNQDAWAYAPRTTPSPWLAVAVSDGHGGVRYPCSHIGAALAVRTAIRVLSRDLRGRAPHSPGDPALRDFHRLCTDWLPKVLVRGWQQRVLRYRARYGSGEPQGAPSPARATEPYGATLMAALFTESVVLFLQLGDGDILWVDAAGQVFRPPLAVDTRLLANETTSLCMAEAWRAVRVHVHPCLGPPPALVLLATDGYANSFQEETGLLQAAQDLHQALTTEGPQVVGKRLPEWLRATSAAGSGDDITLVLAFPGQTDVQM